MTLPLTDLGFIRPDYNDILSKQTQRAKTLFGPSIDTGNNTIIGKYIRLNVADLDEMYQTLEFVYYSAHPSAATGISLDRVCVRAGLARNPATEAKHLVRLYGTSGTVIPLGFMVSSSTQDVIFYTTQEITLVDGQGDVIVACDEPGIVGNVTIGAIDYIVNPVADVESVAHLSIVDPGEDVESDAKLRSRFLGALSGQGNSTIDAIWGALLKVPLVGGVSVEENTTMEMINDQPPKSFSCYVLAPEEADQQIAEAIFSKKPPGIQAAGDIVLPVKDIAGKVHDVGFTRTIQKDVWIRMSIQTDSFFPKNGKEQIATNLINKMMELKNGENVYLSILYKEISIDGVVDVPSLLLSTDGVTYTETNVTCAHTEVARTESGKIEIEEVPGGQ